MVKLGHEGHAPADGQRVSVEQVGGVDEVVLAAVHRDEAEAPLHVEGLDRAPDHAARHDRGLAHLGRADGSRRRHPGERLHAARRRGRCGQPPHHSHGGRWRQPGRDAGHAARVGVCSGDLLRDGLHLGWVVRGLEDDASANRQRVAVEQRRGVHEEVLAAAVRRDEAEALLHVEGLDGTRGLAGRNRQVGGNRSGGHARDLGLAHAKVQVAAREARLKHGRLCHQGRGLRVHQAGRYRRKSSQRIAESSICGSGIAEH